MFGTNKQTNEINKEAIFYTSYPRPPRTDRTINRKGIRKPVTTYEDIHKSFPFYLLSLSSSLFSSFLSLLISFFKTDPRDMEIKDKILA